MGRLTNFPYKFMVKKKFMVIASLLYSISTYISFHRNILLSDSEENLYHGLIKTVTTICV